MAVSCRSAAGVAFVSRGDFHCLRAADLRPPDCNVYVRGNWYVFGQAHLEGRIGCREAIAFELRFTRWLDQGPGQRCLDSLCAGTHPEIAGYRCRIVDLGDDTWAIACRRPGKLVAFGTGA